MNLHLVTGYAGAEHVTSADQGAFHNSVLLKGDYVLNAGKKFSASIVSNNLIKILDGEIYMQGRYIILDSGTYAEIGIENGAQDYKRNDLIVVRYSKNATTGVESTDFVVIQGTPDISSPVDPEYIVGDIQNGDLTADFPLYRIPIVGLSVQEPVALFKTIDNLDERIKALNNNKVDKEAGKGLSTNDYSDAEKEKIDNHIDSTSNPHKVTKSQVGLGNVDNTADAEKSVKYAATAGSAKASDVYSWAKAAQKPSYTASEVGASATGHKHTKSEITDFPSTMTPSAHNQAASTITTGTFAGKVVANATAVAALGDKQVRNIYIGDTDMTAGESNLPAGDIYIYCEGL